MSQRSIITGCVFVSIFLFAVNYWLADNSLTAVKVHDQPANCVKSKRLSIASLCAWKEQRVVQGERKEGNAADDVVRVSGLAIELTIRRVILCLRSSGGKNFWRFTVWRLNSEKKRERERGRFTPSQIRAFAIVEWICTRIRRERKRESCLRLSEISWLVFRRG